MTDIKWTVEAAQSYQLIYDQNSNLRKMIDQRLEALANWPPEAWYKLWPKGSIFLFEMDNDQFLKLTGWYKDGVVWINHFELRTKGRN